MEPAIASKVRFRNNADLEAQIRNLQTIRRNLESILEDTRLDYEDEIKRLRGEVTIWQQKLAGLQTPANFDIPEDVLAKLSNIEKARLVEAVQAYRVGAWTPAASVCGTILEGRLQSLCRENNLPTGGIGQMIRQLGDAKLLKDYYHNLAKVGEFFRHRSSHPTTEEFDKEKVSLILNSLIILLRDLF